MRFFLAAWVFVILALLVWAPSPERSEVIPAIPPIESALPPVSTRSHSQVWAFEIPDKTRGVATLLERPDGATLASDHALVSVSHGVSSREHSLLRISLRNGDIVEKVVVPGEVGRLERDSHGVWTTLISSLDRDKPGTTFTIDPTTGSLLHPIQEGPATWEDARGGATIMDSVPLMSGGRLLTTILLGKPSKVSLVTTDVSGRAAWRLTLDDPTVSSVLAMTATADGGFIYVAERWEGRYPEGSPLSPRIVRMD